STARLISCRRGAAVCRRSPRVAPARSRRWRTSRCARRRRAWCRARNPAPAAYAARRNRAPRPTPHARESRSECPCGWKPWCILDGWNLDSSSRAKRSNPDYFRGGGLDCFVASLLAMTAFLRAHRLDIVAVGIDQECGVISRAIVMAMAGRAVVAAAGLEAFCVEFLDRGMVGRAERDMRALALQALVQVKPQRRLALGAEPRAILVFRAQHEAERRQR